jgi:lysine/ornithine N-monooxygenase
MRQGVDVAPKHGTLKTRLRLRIDVLVSSTGHARHLAGFDDAVDDIRGYVNNRCVDEETLSATGGIESDFHVLLILAVKKQVYVRRLESRFPLLYSPDLSTLNNEVLFVVLLGAFLDFE